MDGSSAKSGIKYDKNHPRRPVFRGDYFACNRPDPVYGDFQRKPRAVKNSFHRFLSATIGFLAISASAPSKTKVDPPIFTPTSGIVVPALESVHWENQLIRENAGKFGLTDISSPELSPSPIEPRSDLLILERFVVTKRAPEKVEMPPPETVMASFFRTGTFAEHVGKKVTTRLWMHPRKGLMLSFEF